jgi:polyisoprenoid-binding protein YceI
MKKALLWIGVGLVVVVGLAVAAYFVFLESDPEPPAAIKETPVRTQPPTSGAAGQDAGVTPTSGLDGTYRVTPGNPDNFVGYRVTEKLFANISETTATGRTDNVKGTLTIDGTTVDDVTVSADLRDLESDSSFRDGRIRSSGLESDTFPEARFVLTTPITLPKVPAAGETISADATGDFTLHGVTRKVTITIEGRWDGRDVQIVGRLPIAFADYGITAPTAPAVASVDDHGEMEFQLFFEKSEA